MRTSALRLTRRCISRPPGFLFLAHGLDTAGIASVATPRQVGGADGRQCCRRERKPALHPSPHRRDHIPRSRRSRTATATATATAATASTSTTPIHAGTPASACNAGAAVAAAAAYPPSFAASALSVEPAAGATGRLATNSPRAQRPVAAARRVRSSLRGRRVGIPARNRHTSSAVSKSRFCAQAHRGGLGSGEKEGS